MTSVRIMQFMMLVFVARYCFAQCNGEDAAMCKQHSDPTTMLQMKSTMKGKAGSSDKDMMLDGEAEEEDEAEDMEDEFEDIDQAGEEEEEEEEEDEEDEEDEEEEERIDNREALHGDWDQYKAACNMFCGKLKVGKCLSARNKGCGGSRRNPGGSGVYAQNHRFPMVSMCIMNRKGKCHINVGRGCPLQEDAKLAEFCQATGQAPPITGKPPPAPAPPPPPPPPPSTSDEACSKHTCKAGFIKRPPHEWRKKASDAGCCVSPAKVGVEFRDLVADEGQDVGGPFTKATIAKCKRECAKIAACKSFSYNPVDSGGTCYLKDKCVTADSPSTSNQQKIAAGWKTMYNPCKTPPPGQAPAPTPAPTPKQASYVERALVADEGNNIGGPFKGATSEKCQSECDKNAACKSFSLNPGWQGGTCYLKDKCVAANSPTKKRRRRRGHGGWKTVYKPC